jgi:phosphate transport system substrate-binding protein
LIFPGVVVIIKRLTTQERRKRMKMIGLLMLAVILAGCAPATKPEQQPLVLRGSNTFGEELAPALIAEYKKGHPDVIFDTEFKGTSYGIGALLAERCDIAAGSRPVSANETAMGEQRGIRLNSAVIGAYSIAVIVNTGNPVANLTSDQVRDIFTGTVTNWKDVGGPDAAIQLYIRDPISGTYLGFRELAMDNKPYSLSVKTGKNYDDIARMVAKDPNGIGYTSVELPKDISIKAVSIGGISPSVEGVKRGTYPYHRLLWLYTDKAKESQAASDFIAFVQSAKGQQILEKMEFVPKP